MHSRPLRRIIAPLTMALLLQGCAGTVVRYDNVDADVELANTPFFPQSDYHCGPAALATVLQYSGVPVTPLELVPEVYVPSKKGSFQVELLAAARRHGRLAYVIAPQFTDIVAELRAGRPVLVMQNLALARLPVWHYAVVVGVDSERGVVLLRSGTTQRLAMPVPKFLRSWRLAGNWGFVALRPDEFPANPERRRLLEAIVAMEVVDDDPMLASAFTKFLDAWPNDPVATLGLGNAYLASARPEEAIRVFQRLLNARPTYVPARNNLAIAYLKVHCPDQARHQLHLALAGDGAERYERALQDTAAMIGRYSDGAPYKQCN